MSSRKLKPRRPSSQSYAQRSAEAAVAKMFKMAKSQFGDAVKSHWLYDSDACPGCGREIDAVKWQGEDAISLNAFIHRKPGVLIGYMLCGHCGEQVMRAGQSPFKRQTPLHTKIEQTLIQAYERYIRSLDA
jgi:hypothetical protein